MAPTKGERYEMMGITMLVKQHALNSRGLLSIIEQEVAPGAGPPLHSCDRVDKIIYALSGQFQIQLGEETHLATTGATAIIARGITHNFKNVGRKNGKLLVVLTFGGHENFLKDLSATVQQPSREKSHLQAVAQKHQVTIL